jgi:hypothetical protein
LEELRQFIDAVFSVYPNVRAHVGQILSRDLALAYIQAHRPS